MDEIDQLRLRVEVLEKLLPALVGRALRRSGLQANEYTSLLKTLVDDLFPAPAGTDDRAKTKREGAQSLLIEMGYAAVQSDIEHPPTS